MEKVIKLSDLERSDLGIYTFGVGYVIEGGLESVLTEPLNCEVRNPIACKLISLLLVPVLS